MKRKYTYFAGVTTFVLAMIGAWFFFTIIWWIFSEHMSYSQVLREPAQIGGFVMLYWWCPGLFILADMYDYDN